MQMQVIQIQVIQFKLGLHYHQKNFRICTDKMNPISSHENIGLPSSKNPIKSELQHVICNRHVV